MLIYGIKLIMPKYIDVGCLTEDAGCDVTVWVKSNALKWFGRAEGWN